VPAWCRDGDVVGFRPFFFGVARSPVAQGLGAYSQSIKAAEDAIKGLEKTISSIVGVVEAESGLSAPTHWDLVHDKQVMQEEQPLQVARCTKIINAGTEEAK
jgi:26S proteasome regulatory subunit T1